MNYLRSSQWIPEALSVIEQVLLGSEEQFELLIFKFVSFKRSKVRFQFTVLLISPKVRNQIEQLRWYFVFIELFLLVLLV